MEMGLLAIHKMLYIKDHSIMVLNVVMEGIELSMVHMMVSFRMIILMVMGHLYGMMVRHMKVIFTIR
jgi:hypothetical protein